MILLKLLYFSFDKIKYKMTKEKLNWNVIWKEARCNMKKLDSGARKFCGANETAYKRFLFGSLTGLGFS